MINNIANSIDWAHPFTSAAIVALLLIAYGGMMMVINALELRAMARYRKKALASAEKRWAKFQKQEAKRRVEARLAS